MFEELFAVLFQSLCLMVVALVTSMFVKRVYREIRSYLKYVEKKAWS